MVYPCIGQPQSHLGSPPSIVYLIISKQVHCRPGHCIYGPYHRTSTEHTCGRTYQNGNAYRFHITMIEIATSGSERERTNVIDIINNERKTKKKYVGPYALDTRCFTKFPCNHVGSLRAAVTRLEAIHINTYRRQTDNSARLLFAGYVISLIATLIQVFIVTAQ